MSKKPATHRGYTLDDVYAARSRLKLRSGVVDLAIGGYGIPLEYNEKMERPSQTVPILARIASGVVCLLPGRSGQWRIVGDR